MTDPDFEVQGTGQIGARVCPQRGKHPGPSKRITLRPDRQYGQLQNCARRRQSRTVCFCARYFRRAGQAAENLGRGNTESEPGGRVYACSDHDPRAAGSDQTNSAMSNGPFASLGRMRTRSSAADRRALLAKSQHHTAKNWKQRAPTAAFGRRGYRLHDSRVTLTMMQCAVCLADLPDGSRFCPNCGAAVSASAMRATGRERSAAVTEAPDTVAAGPTWPSAGREDEPRFPPGSTLLGRYRIISALGKGGMGEVYRADDLRLHQQVALKFLPRDLLDDPDLLARLHQEVRIARQISHRLVCRVHDIAEVDGETFLTMEFIDGEDLRVSS